MEKPDVIELQPHELLLGITEVIRETQESIGYYEMKKIGKTHLDQVISETLQREKKALSEVEIAALAAKLYHQIMHKTAVRGLTLLSRYYSSGCKFNKNELLKEEHKPSRLGRHIKYTGKKRQPNTAAHAIVSGSHPEAIAARKILAKWKIRIDDPDNGVFLPRDSRYIPHKDMPSAANHAKLHTDEYYLNVTNMLRSAQSKTECRMTLRLIADELRNGSFVF